MLHYSPSRLYQGGDLRALAVADGTAQRLGDRALLVTDGDAPRIVDAAKSDLHDAGVEVVIFGEADDDARSDVVERAVRLFVDSRARYVIGLGSSVSLSIGKAACLAAAFPEKTIYDFIDVSGNGRAAPPSERRLPLRYVAVPTQLWNPLVLTDVAVLTDARDKSARRVATAIHPDSVFFSSRFLPMLTEKQAVYDLLCILQSCVEAYSTAGPAIEIPLLAATLSAAAAELSKIPYDDNLVDRESAQILGIHAAFCRAALLGGGSVHTSGTGVGIGAAVGWAVHSKTAIPVQWAAASILSETARASIVPQKAPEIAGHLGLAEGEDVYAVVEELRSLTALADVPLRLRDLAVAAEDLPAIGRTASALCGAPPETIQEILQNSY
jgi:alcohol dehydrogenase class IV